VGLLLTGLVIALVAVALVQRRRRSGGRIAVDVPGRNRNSEPRAERLTALPGLTIGEALAGTPPKPKSDRKAS
jgi:hypothetical protein